jgi:uncharacterized protein (DUF983 family)
METNTQPISVVSSIPIKLFMKLTKSKFIHQLNITLWVHLLVWRYKFIIKLLLEISENKQFYLFYSKKKLELTLMYSVNLIY